MISDTHSRFIPVISHSECFLSEARDSSVIIDAALCFDSKVIIIMKKNFSNVYYFSSALNPFSRLTTVVAVVLVLDVIKRSELLETYQ